MIKGKTRLSGFFVFLMFISVMFLFWAALRSFPVGRFWQIIFRLEAKGSYKVIPGDVEGSYSLIQEWLGFLEEDGPDFIIYHLEVRPVNWDFSEKTPDGIFTVSLNKENKNSKTVYPQPPKFRMEYIKGEEKEICFYFSLDYFPIPINKKTGQQEWLLVFPSIPWEGKDINEIHWSEKITGQKRVSLPRQKLELPEFQGIFGWEEKISSQSCIGASLFQEHRVQISVFLIRCNINLI